MVVTLLFLPVLRRLGFYWGQDYITSFLNSYLFKSSKSLLELIFPQISVWIKIALETPLSRLGVLWLLQDMMKKATHIPPNPSQKCVVWKLPSQRGLGSQWAESGSTRERSHWASRPKAGGYVRQGSAQHITVLCSFDNTLFRELFPAQHAGFSFTVY